MSESTGKRERQKRKLAGVTGRWNDGSVRTMTYHEMAAAAVIRCVDGSFQRATLICDHVLHGAPVADYEERDESDPAYIFPAIAVCAACEGKELVANRAGLT